MASPVAAGDAGIAKVAGKFASMQASRLKELEKLQATLRRQLDDSRLQNKARQRKLTTISSELGSIERISGSTAVRAMSAAPGGRSAAAGAGASSAFGGDTSRSSSPARPGTAAAGAPSSARGGSPSPKRPETAANKPLALAMTAAPFPPSSGRPPSPARKTEEKVMAIEAKSAQAMQAFEEAAAYKSMLLYMAERLQEENKAQDITVARMSATLKHQATLAEAASLSLHQASIQKARAYALLQTLQKALDSQREKRRLSKDRMESTINEQERKLAEIYDREKQRLTSTLMPRGDLDQEGEDRLKQMALVRKIHNNMLLRRLRDDQKRADKLSSAYDRIRSATGLEDVEAIINKFQTRDEAVAALHAQMKGARDKVDALQAEKRRLIWSLDEASAVGASSTDARSYYKSTDEFERSLADAERRYVEAKQRLNKVSLVLEACRSSIATLLERVGLDSASLQGVVAGSAAAGVGGNGGPLSPMPSVGGQFFGSAAPSTPVSVLPSIMMSGEDSMVIGGGAGGIGVKDSQSSSSASSATGNSRPGSGFVTPGEGGRKSGMTAGGSGFAAASRIGVGASTSSAASASGSGRRGFSGASRRTSTSPSRRPLSSAASSTGGKYSGRGSSLNRDGESGHSKRTGGHGGLQIQVQVLPSHVVQGGASAAGAEAGVNLNVVQPEDLENALSGLEERLVDVLTHLAFVVEREEVALAAASGKGVGKLRFGRRPGGGKLGAGGSFSSSASSVMGGGMDAGSAASSSGASVMEGGGGGSVGGGGGMMGGGGSGIAGSSAGVGSVLSTLVDRASSRMFLKTMTAPVDVSEHNVRIPLPQKGPAGGMPTMSIPGVFSSSMSAASVDSYGMGGDSYRAGTMTPGGPGGIGGPSSSSSYYNYQSAATSSRQSRAAQRKAEMEGIQKILKGEGAGAVVDRESLKRLSAIVTASFASASPHTKAAGGGGGASSANSPASPPTSPKSPARGGRPSTAGGFSAASSKLDDQEGTDE